jgi:hypothetical protein
MGLMGALLTPSGPTWWTRPIFMGNRPRESEARPILLRAEVHWASKGILEKPLVHTYDCFGPVGHETQPEIVEPVKFLGVGVTAGPYF